jgi:gas vesicle protein
MTNQKFIAGLILGAAAGTFAAIFLQTDKGKEIISNVKDAANDAEDTLKSKLKSFDEEVSDLLKKGKEYVKDLESKAKSTAKNATS